jgi:8-oxo-dGTP pyrophosphatase MutT (NUDIX family)
VPWVTAAGAPFRWLEPAAGVPRLVLTGGDFAANSAALAVLVDRLVAAGELRPALGEHYAVTGPRGEGPLAQLDRTAVAWFGVRAAGVHLTGYVRSPAGLAVWVSRRAAGKRSYPGHLDNLVAGGQPFGLRPWETLRKECHEEAGIAAELAERAVAVGCLRYTQQDGRSLKPDTLWCFDLELPADFVPRAVDGEVEAFDLVPAAALLASLGGPAPWKPNSALVAIDFLLRHGLLDPVVPAATRWSWWRTLRERS